MRAGMPSRIRCQHCREKIRLTNLKSFLNVYIPAVLLLGIVLASLYFFHIIDGWILLLLGIVLFEVIEFATSVAIVRRGIFEKPMT